MKVLHITLSFYHDMNIIYLFAEFPFPIPNPIRILNFISFTLSRLFVSLRNWMRDRSGKQARIDCIVLFYHWNVDFISYMRYCQCQCELLKSKSIDISRYTDLDDTKHKRFMLFDIFFSSLTILQFWEPFFVLQLDCIVCISTGTCTYINHICFTYGFVEFRKFHSSWWMFNNKSALDSDNNRDIFDCGKKNQIEESKIRAPAINQFQNGCIFIQFPFARQTWYRILYLS